MRRIVRFILVIVVLLIWGATVSAEQQLAPIFEELGDHHHPITTTSEQAQRYFDQGLILAFGFNHGEAHRSFMQATKLDPECAMCWWGAALVLGPNINSAMDPAKATEAWRLTEKALSLTERVTPREKAYIRALAERYRPEAVEDRSRLDRAWAEAMGGVANRFPEDLDARVLYAEALMDTTPWNYWKENGSPRPVTETILATLESVIREDANHPMANHLYVHAVEAQHPEKGLEEAKRLETLVPGAGHLVHMPAHIYIRTGDYHAATRANQRAIEADQRYLEQVDAHGVYRLAYVPHNYHFLWSTATLEGRSELAIETAREMASIVDEERMRERPLATLQHYWITPLYALVRFGRWDEILGRDEPAEDLVYPRGVWHYARGMAFARKGRFGAAESELAALRDLLDDPRLEWVTVWDINKSRHILAIAEAALSGEIEAAKGNFEDAIEKLDRAVELEDDLNYDEPPTWHYPTRHSLGAVLLEAGEAERAEAVYREDLETFPDNGWALFGLLESLRRQGETEAAAKTDQKLREAWRHADVVLTSSRF
ncbi:MAG: hypothetical protein R3338_00265 [Thermoanaerobaculia bacterium]|nr:hypothetical protein [Thermoanaerobaculia bacterium]